MRLSIAAQHELRDILHREIGVGAQVFDDEAINDLGERFLRLAAAALKGKRPKPD